MTLRRGHRVHVPFFLCVFLSDLLGLFFSRSFGSFFHLLIFWVFFFLCVFLLDLLGIFCEKTSQKIQQKDAKKTFTRDLDMELLIFEAALNKVGRVLEGKNDKKKIENLHKGLGHGVGYFGGRVEHAVGRVLEERERPLLHPFR